MANEITIDRTAWKMFKVALCETIEREGADDAFAHVLSMVKAVDDDNAEIRAAQPEAAQ